MRYLTALLILLATAVAHADTTITYQGQLQDASGPVTGTPGMEFRLYDNLIGGSQVGDAVVANAVPVTEGLFQVDLDFGEQAYAGGLWLAIIIEGSPLEPRQAITGAPFAISAAAGSGSNWAISGSDIYYSDGNVGIGTSSPSVALDVIGSATFGASTNQAIEQLSFVGGGSQNTASGLRDTVVGGFQNIASGGSSFVAGGSLNHASGARSFVGGGEDNVASGRMSFVGGGGENTANGFQSFIGGGQANSTGQTNTTEGQLSFIGGGAGNIASGLASFIGGGVSNRASGSLSFAAGRRANAQHDGAVVWADDTNSAFESSGINQFLIRAGGGVGVNTENPANSLTVAGDADFSGAVGIGTISPSVALDVVGSGKFGHSSNLASGTNTFVAGGANGIRNHAEGNHSFVGGGLDNFAGADTSFVGGGRENTASGSRSFVGGGFGNSATGDWSFVSGGNSNTASGVNSFAAGIRAKAVHDYAFVWDSNPFFDYASTGKGQFLIRATGGVGIGTNNPTNSLSVRGAADFGGAVGIGNGTSEPNSQLHINAPAGDDPMRAQVDGQTAFAVDSGGGVAIGGFTALTPANGLYVAGRTGLGTAVPQRDLHIKQSSTSNGEIGLQIERSGSSTNNWAFYVATSDNLGFRYNDTLVARINTSGAFAQLSDARFKTDIEPLSGALERLMRLEPASYRMTMEAADDPVSIGLIAQQVSEVLPGAVSEQEGTLGVYYNQITALNTAALIELNIRQLAVTEQQRKAFDAQQIVIEAQQDRIAESEQRLGHMETENAKLRQLAERNDRLESRMAALEALLIEDRQVMVRSQ